MNVTYPINSFSLETTTATSAFKITRVSVELFSNVTICVNLYNNSNALINVTTITMPKTDYIDNVVWGNNDDNVISFVAKSLGLSLLNK